MYNSQEKYKKVTEGHYKFMVGGKPCYVLWGSGRVPTEIRGNVIVTDIFGKSLEKSVSDIVLTNEPIYVTMK